MNKRLTPLFEKETGIRFNYETCRFDSEVSSESLIQAIESFHRPMSVILQVTRRCPLSCIFCSETEFIADPSLDTLKMIKNHLNGVSRVFLSGGEPLIRKDIGSILEIFADEFVVGLATNAMVSSQLASVFKGKIAFANIGLDGPRSITSRTRGGYDSIMLGIKQFLAHDIPISLTGVILRSTMDSVPYLCQIADTLGAKKVKLVSPIPKGNALELSDDEYINQQEAGTLFNNLQDLKNRFGWTPKITFTTWNKETEGYSILVYPDGRTFAWPVFSTEDKVLFIGNLIQEPIECIWDRYPFKLNHLRKYLGKSILIA